MIQCHCRLAPSICRGLAYEFSDGSVLHLFTPGPQIGSTSTNPQAGFSFWHGPKSSRCPSPKSPTSPPRCAPHLAISSPIINAAVTLSPRSLPSFQTRTTSRRESEKIPASSTDRKGQGKAPGRSRNRRRGAEGIGSDGGGWRELHGTRTRSLALSSFRPAGRPRVRDR